jgi:hypothetical protein
VVIALISGRPAASRTWSRLDAAEHIDLLTSRRIGDGREVELQLALLILGSSRIGDSHKG